MTSKYSLIKVLEGWVVDMLIRVDVEQTFLTKIASQTPQPL